jgi:hypothetical protein
MPQEGLWKKVQVITMGTFTYTTDSEIVSGHSADRFKAAAGLGDGFNGHAGTGTVAQAAEQVTQATRWFASTTRSTVEGAIKGDSEAKADALGLQLAVVDQALRLNGFKATWSVKTENGTEQVDPRNASMALATFASTLAVEITTLRERATHHDRRSPQSGQARWCLRGPGEGLLRVDDGLARRCYRDRRRGLRSRQPRCNGQACC